MNPIDLRMVAAVKKGAPWNEGDTIVEHKNGETLVVFRNFLVIGHVSNAYLRLSSSGCPTPIVYRRLNALLLLARPMRRIYWHDREPFFDGQPMDPTDVVTINRRSGIYCVGNGKLPLKL